MKKKAKPLPAIEVEFTRVGATVTARVLRQKDRSDGDKAIVFGTRGGYYVKSLLCLALDGASLWLHGSCKDEELACHTFPTVPAAKRAVTAWSKIIESSKPPATPKPPKAIVTVARSKRKEPNQ